MMAGVKGASQSTTVSLANTENASDKVTLSHNEELLHEIAVTYYQHGYMTSDVARKKEYLADKCDTMPEDACSDYLSQELVTAKKARKYNRHEATKSALMDRSALPRLRGAWLSFAESARSVVLP